MEFQEFKLESKEVKKPRRPNGRIEREQRRAAAEREYPCTQCGGDATLAYSEGWDGKVKKGERLCTSCFSKRGGKRFF